jgi:hypothetical protein
MGERAGATEGTGVLERAELAESTSNSERAARKESTGGPGASRGGREYRLG